ncbi:MAG: hypothetical protein DRJ40_08620 [Thermoprotei archaeon]|nr:MAG: hypothetical protein DRJ40_08620 [Thermoprotei archaeon]
MLLMTRLYSYQVVITSVTEILLAIYLLRDLGIRLSDLYRDDVRNVRCIGWIALLVLFCEGLFFLESLISANLYYSGDVGKYWSWWYDMIKHVPLWARYFNALAIPFISGVCEEVIYRAYGVTALEKLVGFKKAVIIQAIAFGVFHVWPLHILITFTIGLVFGLVYVRRRKLTVLTVAHTLVDLIGFSTFIVPR